MTPVAIFIWRDDIEARRRWMSVCCQLLRMQRDIAEAKRHTPGTTTA